MSFCGFFLVSGLRAWSSEMLRLLKRCCLSLLISSQLRFFLSLSLSLSLSLFLLIDRMLTSLRSLLVALVKTYSITLLKHMLYLDTPYHLLSGKSSVVMHEGLPEVYVLTNG